MEKSLWFFIGKKGHSASQKVSFVQWFFLGVPALCFGESFVPLLLQGDAVGLLGVVVLLLHAEGAREAMPDFVAVNRHGGPDEPGGCGCHGRPCWPV